MRRMLLLRSALVACCVVAAACTTGGDVLDGAGEFVPPTPPGTPPPTGNKWQGIEVEGDCGRLTMAWVLVDETCGGTADPGYLDAFRAPMFRDGARIGDDLFVVDATHLWVLDATDPAALARRALVAGLGEPLSVATHDGRLLVAAGAEGLLVLDVSNPTKPTRTAELALPGPALQVRVSGERALVSMGAAGVAVVDLSSPSLKVAKVLAVPGFAAAAVERDGLGYVAACDQLVIVETASGKILSSTWVAQPYVSDILVAPAKGVELVGDVAFVAAGRYGTVGIEVSDPTKPKLTGLCTEPHDLSYYVSGVRAADGKLFAAAGEWGVEAIDVTEPELACTAALVPDLPPLPQTDEPAECGSEPPWQVLPWQDLWAPPPPAKDPIQTLPVAGQLYAFGDARRVGARAVDVRDPGSEELAKLGRYDEPRRVVDLALSGERVLVVGPGGGVFTRSEDSLLLGDPDPPAAVRAAVAGDFLSDGRWVVGTADGLVHVEGQADPMPVIAPLYSHGIVTSGAGALVAVDRDLVWLDVDTGELTSMLGGWLTAELPVSVAVRDSEIFVAAPEWPRAARVDELGGELLAPHGVFDETGALDLGAWMAGLPRRVLVASDHGLVEVATLGTRAGLVVHDGSAEPPALALPAGTYSGGASDGDRVFLVATDRASYRSVLYTIDIGAAVPQVLSIDSFTGVATDVVAADGRLYLADADRGIRVYAIDDGFVAPLGIVALDEEVQP